MHNESFPKDFTDRIAIQFGTEHEQLLASLQEEPATSIHLHKRKKSDRFAHEQVVRWFENGRVLNERPSFTLDPLFHAGCYYPQESSSMFLHQAMTQLFGGQTNLLALDLCAAPGGKSILISSFLGNNGRLISNEVIKQRNAVLRENLTKWGCTNTIVTCNDPVQFSTLTSYFDCIVVDAPCSGEGMFRKDKKARAEWSKSNVEHCSVRQKRIVHDVLPSLKEGGYLIYSTCTFSAEENELNCKKWIAQGELECVSLQLEKEWNIHEIKTDGVIAYQFLPHKTSGEGFFLCVMKKLSGIKSHAQKRSKQIFSSATKNELNTLPNWINIQNESIIKSNLNDHYASCFSAEELNDLCVSLYITMPGVELGKFLRTDFVPAHPLALSALISISHLSVALDLENSLKYLRGENIPINAPQGWYLVTHQTHPLGWVKVLERRVNNYYPKEWRIRMR